MDTQKAESLVKIMQDGKSKISKLLGDMGKTLYVFRVLVIYGKGYGKQDVDYNSEGKMKSLNRVIKLNGIGGLEGFLKHFKAPGFNHAKFQDVMLDDGNTGKPHENSEELTDACNELMKEFLDAVLRPTKSVPIDSSNVKELKASNAEMAKELADLKAIVMGEKSVDDAKVSAKVEKDLKDSGAGTPDELTEDEKELNAEIKKEEQVKTLLESGKKDEIVKYIIENIDKEATEAKLNESKVDELKAMIVNAQS